MSESDFKGRLPRPRIALERRPLSNSASTASCNIRFSLRRMTSGARCRMSFCSRLLRLMTRRYRSFRSDVAKRPPSSGTSGRRSGGITGTTARIIHSGRLPEFLNADTTFRRFDIFFRRAHPGAERIRAVLLVHLPIAGLGQQLALLQRRRPGVDHDVGLEVEDLLE